MRWTTMTTSRPSGAITTYPTRSWRSWLDDPSPKREGGLILLGLDPGLGTTGWGVIAAEGNRLRHLANGQIRTDAKAELPARLVGLHAALAAGVAENRTDAAAVEEVFVNENPQSTLKLGQARGVVLLAAAATGVEVGEYAPR